jgi:hypothetical protein
MRGQHPSTTLPSMRVENTVADLIQLAETFDVAYDWACSDAVSGLLAQSAGQFPVNAVDCAAFCGTINSVHLFGSLSQPSSTASGVTGGVHEVSGIASEHQKPQTFARNEPAGWPGARSGRRYRHEMLARACPWWVRNWLDLSLTGAYREACENP